MHVSLRSTENTRQELREILILGGPIALVQLGQTSLNLVDVAMLGHFDAASLPAMALGNTLTWAALVFCMGAAAAVDPLLSQAVGARDPAAITRTLLRGIVLVVALALPAMLLLQPAATWLAWFGQKPELIPDAALYARLNTLGFLPFLWFGLLRSLLSAHARLWPQVATIVVGNVANAILDYAWIYGRFGFPALGTAGAAWATVVCRWTMFATLLLSSRRDTGPHLRRLLDRDIRREALAIGPLLRLLRLGAPIGAQFALEMGVFAVTALLVGRFDAAAVGERGGPRLGGHQIALQLASLSFMVPLGLGMAATVRVGWAVGRGDHAAARRTVKAALLTGALVMTAFMASFLLLPRTLAGLFTADQGILAWGVMLIPLAGVFQIGDGIQVVAIGCLRGIGDVVSPMVINVLGFWAIGLPLGCWLGFDWGLGLGAQGLWWGLAAGLFAVALCLVAMLRTRFRGPTARLSVD
jgi:MATE family multidrug resistance protein